MSTFTLHLYSMTQNECLPNVVSFSGVDNSGKFGILPNHMRMMTRINLGLSQIKYDNLITEYLVLAGGVIYFVDNTLCICTKRYLRGTNYHEMAAMLDQQLQAENMATLGTNKTMGHLEELLLQRLWLLEREE